jgi:hypothetical protein
VPEQRHRAEGETIVRRVVAQLAQYRNLATTPNRIRTFRYPRFIGVTGKCPVRGPPQPPERDNGKNLFRKNGEPLLNRARLT